MEIFESSFSKIRHKLPEIRCIHSLDWTGIFLVFTHSKVHVALN